MSLVTSAAGTGCRPQSQGETQPFLRFFGAVNSSGVIARGSQPILSSTSSISAMSATPRLGVVSINGRLPAEFSCRTRRETRLTRMFGLPTFSSAFLQNSAFKFLFQFVQRVRQPNRGPRTNAIQKTAMSNSHRAEDPASVLMTTQLEPVAKVLVLHLCRKLCRSLSGHERKSGDVFRNRRLRGQGPFPKNGACP